MKNTRKSFFILLLLVGMLFLLTACFESPETDDTETATTEPVETEPVETEPAETGEHVHEWDGGKVTVEATCEQVGTTVYTCLICGETRTEEVEGHTWDDGRIIVAPTCKSSGSRLYTCTKCNQRRADTIPPTGEHTFVAGTERIITPPTQNQDGEAERICTVCGATGISSVSYATYVTRVSEIRTQVNSFKIADFGGADISNDLSAKAGVSYAAPPVNPISQHPRVMINESALAGIRAEFSAKRSNAAVKLFRSAVIDPTDGKLPTSSSHNNFSTDVIDNIQALALDYLLTGNEISGYSAILAVKNYLLTMDFAGISSNAERQYGYSMYTFACVYDWCYPLLSAVDRRQIVSGVEHIVLADDHMEMGFPPSKQYSVAGHGCEFQLLRDYLAFAIAIYDEYPGWWNFIAGRIYEQYVAPRNYYYQAGMVTQGVSLYVRIRFASDLYSAILLKAGTGTMPYDEAGMKQVMRTVYSYELPRNEAFASGDNNLDDGSFTEYSRNTLLSSYLFDDATMRAQLEYFKKSYSTFTSYYTVGSNFVEYLICSSNGVKAASDRHEGMSLILYNGGWLGQIIARNNWGDDQAAVLMKIGVRTGGNHDHCDAGQFQIFYKAMLAGDTGDYDSYGTTHWRNYHQATIAHNSILINGTGQVKRGGNEMSHNNYLKDSNTLTGEVTGVQYGYADADKTEPLYAYIAGNISKAYDSSVASNVTRRMLTVFNTGNPDIQMFFFVYDNVTAKSSPYKKTFLLHVPTEPTVSGKSVTVVSGGAKMVLQNVFGADTIETIGGVNKNYMVDGTQLSAGNDGFWGRVEISNSGSATSQMLNVIYVSTANATMSPKAVAITSDVAKGAVIGNTAAIFVTSDTRQSSSFTVKTSGSGDLNYYVSGVAAGSWTITVGSTTKNLRATEDGGFLYFTAPAGTVTLTKK